MLALMEAELDRLKISHVKVTGDVKTKDRDIAIRAFNETDVQVFLSSDAGAYGVNLDRGSHLICYDLPWSVGHARSAGGTHRPHVVLVRQITVSYVYCANTIEERMFDQLTTKMKVANAWVDGDFDQDTGSLPLDFQSLSEFLTDG